ncbi:MAG: contact-dependent growth inhibition system immunity protein [Vicinamibacterales bacterium]
MHRRTTASPAPLRPADFAALASFLKGYLHEDFREVHGSVRAAAAAFCADANLDERRQLARELATLARIGANRPVRDLRRFITRDLGSRWEPASRSEISTLHDLIRAAI